MERKDSRESKIVKRKDSTQCNRVERKDSRKSKIVKRMIVDSVTEWGGKIAESVKLWRER